MRAALRHDGPLVPLDQAGGRSPSASGSTAVFGFIGHEPRPIIRSNETGASDETPADPL